MHPDERGQITSTLQATWQKLVDEEEAAYEKCCLLDRDSYEVTPEKAEAVRCWWSAANAILWMFVRTQAQHNHYLSPPPVMFLGRLANITEEISVGNIPSFVLDAKSGGRPRWRRERHHIAYAVLYIEAAKRGDIDDRAYNKTVRRAFNVTARAVQQWILDRDEICIGVPHRHLSPDQLKKKMLECGAIYSRIGRGAPSDN